MNRQLGFFAGISGLVAVAAGAFGAHALKDRLTADALAVYETAVKYHMYHTLALLGVAVLLHARPSRAARASAACFVAGIVLFSGSLYVMALSDMAWRSLGAFTPIGGVLLAVGWLLLAVAARRR